MVSCAGEISSKLLLAQQRRGRSLRARSNRLCLWSGLSTALLPKEIMRHNAKTLGLTIPPSLFTTADEVIE
jgi:hypothetical protein